MQAIVLGATGAVGRDLVAQLLADSTFEEVHLFVRRQPQGFDSERLHTHIVDFDQPEQWQDKIIAADVLFSCLGTTLSDAGSQEVQYRVDYTFQYELAAAAAARGVRHYVLVSAMLANARSRSFYTRIKGELEEAVQSLGFTSVAILRPPVLIRKGTTRLGERITLGILRVLNGIGLLRGYRPMPTAVVASCMIALAKEGASVTLEPKDIWTYTEAKH